MTSLRHALIAIAAVVAVTVTGPGPAASQSRTVGQVIDDTAITAQVKAKLTGDKLSNLTKIEVRTDQGVVTLNGTVDSADRIVRAEQLATSVKGVRGIVNNLHVAGATIDPPGIGTPTATYPAGAGLVDATGVVSHFDPATGTLTLQDGRVLRTTNDTIIWQPTTMQGLRPGSTVHVRGAAPIGVAPSASAAPPAPPDWRMGTVRGVDPPGGYLMLTDGTVVRVAPSTLVRRGRDRMGLDQIVSGTEVVIRTVPPAWSGTAEGSALPGRVTTVPTVDASEVSVVWVPSGIR